MAATQRKWREKEMEMALKEIEDGLGIRKAAKKFGVPESSIRGQRSKNPESRKMILGEEPEIGLENEKKLSECIRVLCRNGFSPKPVDVLFKLFKN